MDRRNEKYILSGVALVALLVIGMIGYALGKHEGRQEMHSSMSPKEAQQKDIHAEMSMDQMSGSLEDLKGDQFDKAFLEMMILHHQGAVEMAKHIPAQAKHEELKKLGSEIIDAQTKEIEMMKGWLQVWGYEKDSTGMDHSNMKH